MQPQQNFAANNPDPNVVCTQCGAPMPREMRFCRSCGTRLGEGPAEYTETVRFPNGQTAPGSRGTTPFYAAPLAQSAASRMCLPKRRRMRGMTWVWIVIAFVFVTGGISSAFRRAGRGRPPAIFASAPRSYFGVDGLRKADGGVTFESVNIPDGPADKAGLVGGDIITSFDGQSPQDEDQMMDLLRKTPIGKTVDVVYLRDGQTKNTKLTTISESESNDLGRIYRSRPEGRGYFGFESSRTTAVANGVRLNYVERNGPADLFGLKVGDIITDFDGVPIRTRGELLSRVYRAKPKSSVEVTLLRDGQVMKIPVTMGRN